MSTDIKAYIENCMVCREKRPAHPHEPLLPTSLPSRPWEKLGADLFEIKRKQFLVVIDYYSRWIEIKPLISTTSLAVIGHLKEVFANHGIPDELFSSNGPQFVSQDFRQFAAKYGFHTNTSSPHFPQANGEAERAVQIAKAILSQSDPDIALLNYRNTPHASTNVSPALALMGRRLKTRIPVLGKKLVPQMPAHTMIRESDKCSKQRYKEDFDRRHGLLHLSNLMWVIQCW